VEAQAVRRADAVLTRSSKAVEILHARAGAGTSVDKFHVVTNGRDAERFKPANAAESAQMRRNLGLSIDTPLIIYAGSMGPQYCMDEMLRLFALVHARRPDAHLLVLTGSPEAVQPALDKQPQLSGCVTTLTVPAQAVAQYLGCADVGLALRQPSFSMQAVAPIKLGEYLLCGLPVVATTGIGDTEAISTDVGMLLQRMDDAELVVAADWFVDSVLPQRESYRASSRAVGLNRFSLEASTESYQHVLEHLGGTP
jgi:glycosyltransferase involved in cell wall biosynthesis